MGSAYQQKSKKAVGIQKWETDAITNKEDSIHVTSFDLCLVEFERCRDWNKGTPSL